MYAFTYVIVNLSIFSITSLLSELVFPLFLITKTKCIHIYIYRMQGCHTPPPPPTPWYPRVACQVGNCLVWPCCFPRLVLFGLVPSRPCGVAPVLFLVGPAPPVGGSVFYRGMVWLLPLVGSNVIVTCLVPSPRCGLGPVVVLVGPAPPVWGSVFYRDIVWLLPLVSSNVIVTCSLPYKI